VHGNFVKQPTAACAIGYCEADPITSTLHVDTQGFCDQIDSISILQQQYDLPGETYAVYKFKPNCSALWNGNELLFCVWNLDNTFVQLNYNTNGTGGNVVEVDQPVINCQVTSQRCDAIGGLTLLCPNLGCLNDPMNGPTLLNFAVSQVEKDFSFYIYIYNINFLKAGGSLLNYFTQSPIDVANTNGGCFYVPALPDLTLTIAEGCCQLNNVTGLFSGHGCVNYTSSLTQCNLNAPCAPLENFGRVLAAFDLAYLPQDDGSSTVSVSLESTADCGPFRFKTSQGGSPRCYCVLPIELRARIIETNLDYNTQACKCTDAQSCLVKYPLLDQVFLKRKLFFGFCFVLCSLFHAVWRFFDGFFLFRIARSATLPPRSTLTCAVSPPQST
jgi:hypothetical protein